MTAVFDNRHKQRAVIEFLCCENETVGIIHKRLKKVYGDAAVDRSTFSRWASRLSGERGQVNIRDTPRSGRPCTARSLDNVQRVNNMVVADKRVTVKELSLQVTFNCPKIGLNLTSDTKKTPLMRQLGQEIMGSVASSFSPSIAYIAD
ncbi:hypothetical protein ANN_15835 [Periplaneta americana]|uniref:Mos1 transposase HTH domain-containing protein n=1 Tax=Periplaneta americana TaxID=6978 RepID=A0ABQ8SHB3_PERAM|nr:hypothetical protein ANN_15835 [Periplaneta americana]